jgi:hypothetical protein
MQSALTVRRPRRPIQIPFPKNSQLNLPFPQRHTGSRRRTRRSLVRKSKSKRRSMSAHLCFPACHFSPYALDPDTPESDYEIHLIRTHDPASIPPDNEAWPLYYQVIVDALDPLPRRPPSRPPRGHRLLRENQGPPRPAPPTAPLPTPPERTQSAPPPLRPRQPHLTVSIQPWWGGRPARLGVLTNWAGMSSPQRLAMG